MQNRPAAPHGKSYCPYTKSCYRQFLFPFLALIPALFRATGKIVRAGHYYCPETLLAGMGTALA